MHWLLTEIIERIIFCFLVIALIAKIWMSASRFRKNNLQIFQQRLEYWRWYPKWMTSRIFILLAVTGFLWMGITTAVQAHRWYRDKKIALQQKILPVELHVPNTVPDRTYTVVVKFRIQGRPYQSSPLQIKFGTKKPSYSLTLYYDVKNPANNSWAKFQAPDKYDLNQVMRYAIGFMFLGIPLLNWLEIRLIRCRLAHGVEHLSL